MAIRLDIGIPTKNRASYVALLIQSLRAQTFQEWDLILVDDSDSGNELSQHHFLVELLKLIAHEGHRFLVIRGLQKGAPYGHNIALSVAKHPYLVRIDDDILLQPDFLEKLVEVVQKSKEPIGAVGGVYPDLSRWLEGKSGKPYLDNPEEGFFFFPIGSLNLLGLHQRTCYTKGEPVRVEHLYSTFLYNVTAVREVGGFPLCYSPFGEGEETDLTYRLHHCAYPLYVHPLALGWHLLAPKGGRRQKREDLPEYFEQDKSTLLKRIYAIKQGVFDYEKEKAQYRQFAQRYPPPAPSSLDVAYQSIVDKMFQ